MVCLDLTFAAPPVSAKGCYGGRHQSRYCARIVETLHDGHDGSEYRPNLKLKLMRDAGYLGRKVRRGSAYGAPACLLTLPPDHVAFSIDVSADLGDCELGDVAGLPKVSSKE
jgi:hypothetical protein